MAPHAHRSAEALPRVDDRGKARHVPADLLALVTSVHPWSPSVTAAFSLAGRWGSHVTGCFVAPALRGLRGRDEEPTVFSLLLESPGEAAGGEAFGKLARLGGVRSATWTSARAGLARTMHQLGAWHDLILLERDIGADDGDAEVLGEALLGCRRPCLLLPPDPGTTLGFDRVVLAWNGGLEAARAIHAALPFLSVARDVVVLDGAPAAPSEDGMPAPRFHPVEYLASHGIAARRRRIDASSHEAGDALLREAQRMDANLLVMGAYGRSRLRERVLGGATRQVLQQAALPVLIQH